MPVVFKEADPRWAVLQAAEAQARGDWWKVFSDPVLDHLVERAGLGNTNIQLAAARLAQARALVRSAAANRSPQADAAAGLNRQGGPLVNAAGSNGTLITASVNLSYEVDLLGRLSMAQDAAALDAQSRDALLQSTRLVEQADVAQTYFSLRSLDAERAVANAAVQSYRDSLRLTERRLRAGLVAELDVARLRTEVATSQAEVLTLERRRAELEHALALLVGEAATQFNLAQTPWVTTLPLIPAGIPSEMLARRPDVSAAQRSLLAAQTRLGAARTAWFPSLVLTASGGQASPDLGDLFRMSTRAWGLGALLALPLFDGGRREAATRQADAEVDAMLATYRGQVLTAFKDVEDQLSSLRWLAELADVHARGLDSAGRATTLSDSRYGNGLISQLDLLDARRTEWRTRRQALQVQLAQFHATVGLIRALGGGWDSPPRGPSQGTDGAS